MLGSLLGEKEMNRHANQRLDCSVISIVLQYILGTKGRTGTSDWGWGGGLVQKSLSAGKAAGHTG